MGAPPLTVPLAARRPVPHGRHQQWPQGGGHPQGGGEDAAAAHHPRGEHSGPRHTLCPRETWARGASGCPSPWWRLPGGSRASGLAWQDLKQQEFFLGCSKVSGKLDWKVLDEAVFQVFKVKRRMFPQRWLVLPLATEPHGHWGPGTLGLGWRDAKWESRVPLPLRLPLFPLRFLFLVLLRLCVCLLGVPHCPLGPLSCQDYISKMDPASTLGLSTESIHGYSISHVKRVLDAEPPEMPPCRRGVTNISVSLKGQWYLCGPVGGGVVRHPPCVHPAPIPEKLQHSEVRPPGPSSSSTSLDANTPRWEKFVTLDLSQKAEKR